MQGRKRVSLVRVSLHVAHELAESYAIIISYRARLLGLRSLLNDFVNY